jgi:acetyltransferase-like isoleucine patch superfamily enzyme
MFKFPFPAPPYNKIPTDLKKRWCRFWMRRAGFNCFGRVAMRLAALFVPLNHERIPLSYMNEKGFIEHTATICHKDLIIGKHCYIGDSVVINERKKGGRVQLGNNVEINRNSIIETGVGGRVTIGDFSSIHPNCHIFSYVEPITIGTGVMIAPACALFSYNHGIAPAKPIRNQPLESKGPIIIGNEAWLGTHVKILHGVTIGDGATIGAGSVVLDDIPDNAMAAGVPAKVIGFRS